MLYVVDKNTIVMNGVSMSMQVNELIKIAKKLETKVKKQDKRIKNLEDRPVYYGF